MKIFNIYTLTLGFIFHLSCSPLPEYIISAKNPDINKEREAKILSAFFGLDNDMPLRSAGIWRNAPGKDGMPLVFSHEINPATLDISDIQISMQNGNKIFPSFVTFKPAIEEFELRTVLLIGEFGNAPENEPILVEIVGELKTRDGQDLKGQKVKVTPLADGPFISYAEWFVIDNEYP